MPGQKRSYSSYRSSYRRRPYRRRSYYRRSTVPRRRISGHGDYKTWWAGVKKRWFRPYTGNSYKTGAALGGAIGNVIAPGIGGTLGSAAGTLAGAAVDRIMGWGDYKIMKNTIAMPSQASSVPSFGKGSIRITHREYIGTVLSSTGFQVSAYSLNPGLVTSFPWLSQLAQNFEQYRWNGLVFQFVSTSADALNSTDTALGKVVLATDYNAEDASFVDIQQMMGTEFSNMGKPSNDIMHAIECAPSEQAINKYWIRTGSVDGGQDLRLYDLGLFQIATTGSQAEAVVGDLWVTYDVTLSKPVMNNQLGYTLPIAHYTSDDGVEINTWFGDERTKMSGSNIETELLPNTIELPVEDTSGTYKIDLYISGTIAAALANPTITYQDCVLKPNMLLGTLGLISNEGVTDNIYFLTLVVQVTGRDARIVFTGGTGVMPTGTVVMDLYITRIPYDLA